MGQSHSSSRAEEAPKLGGIRFGPLLAGALYALLVASAALALGLRQATASWLFLAFAICFAIYRFRLVLLRKYPASKAFFQVGAAVLFFTLLLPKSKSLYAPEIPTPSLELLLADPNPTVRALAAEVTRHRSDGERYGPALVRALEDPDPLVRKEAHRSLVRLNGRDLGPADNEAARKAWGERFREP